MGLRPSQITLLSALTIYPILFRLLTGPRPTSTRYAASLKATSTLHSLLTTYLALSFLRGQRWPAVGRNTPSSSNRSAYPDDAQNPTISQRSEFGNSITALETGYLLQDTVALILQARLFGRNGQLRKGKVLDKTLLTHHVLIGTALLVLQYYIAHNREAGIYVIVQFLLMNASTPLLNLRWYLRQYFQGKMRNAILMVADVAFAVSFFAARVGLVWKILKDYGKWHGLSAWETYWTSLRMPCQIGTGALFVANAGWWSVMVGNLVGRSKEFTFGGQ